MDSYNIPIVRITPGSVLQYNLPTYRPHKIADREIQDANLTRGKFKGTISEKSRRKLKRTAESWLISIQEAKRQKKAHNGLKRRYVTFITLTLASTQVHSDNVIKRELLNTFIIYAIRNFNVQEYLWRAEAQANGNIHFHLFMDSYIHWRQLRDCWNTIQNRLGYVDAFKRIHKHNDPNSTDIERIKSAKGASLYVTKYIAKESTYRVLEGRVWGCSDGLRTVQPFEQIADSEYFGLINHLKNDKSKRVVYSTNYCVYLGDISKVLTTYYPSIWKEIVKDRCKTYKDLYP
jgi:hypothetical protein